jgi:hypothetical protein
MTDFGLCGAQKVLLMRDAQQYDMMGKGSALPLTYIEVLIVANRLKGGIGGRAIRLSYPEEEDKEHDKIV